MSQKEAMEEETGFCSAQQEIKKNIRLLTLFKSGLTVNWRLCQGWKAMAGCICTACSSKLIQRERWRKARN
eukprot:936361-Ditylum_brightwellii.AAC.1